MSGNIWERGFTSLVKHVTETTDESLKAFFFFFFKRLSVPLEAPHNHCNYRGCFHAGRKASDYLFKSLFTLILLTGPVGSASSSVDLLNR